MTFKKFVRRFRRSESSAWSIARHRNTELGLDIAESSSFRFTIRCLAAAQRPVASCSTRRLAEQKISADGAIRSPLIDAIRPSARRGFSPAMKSGASRGGRSRATAIARVVDVIASATASALTALALRSAGGISAIWLSAIWSAAAAGEHGAGTRLLRQPGEARFDQSGENADQIVRTGPAKNIWLRLRWALKCSAASGLSWARSWPTTTAGPTTGAPCSGARCLPCRCSARRVSVRHSPA